MILGAIMNVFISKSYLYYCLFELRMRTLGVAGLVGGEEPPGPLASDLPVGGQGGALEGPRAAEEEGDRVNVALAVTLV